MADAGDAPGADAALEAAGGAVDAVEAARAAAAAAEDALAPPSCTVCMDDLAIKRQLRLQPCGHAFHRLCALEWMESREEKSQQLCPNCRTAMLAVKDHHGRDRVMAMDCLGSGGKPTKNFVLAQTRETSIKTYLRGIINRAEEEASNVRVDLGEFLLHEDETMAEDCKNELDKLEKRKDICEEMIEIYDLGGMRIPDPTTTKWDFRSEFIQVKSDEMSRLKEKLRQLERETARAQERILSLSGEIEAVNSGGEIPRGTARISLDQLDDQPREEATRRLAERLTIRDFFRPREVEREREARLVRIRDREDYLVPLRRRDPIAARTHALFAADPNAPLPLLPSYQDEIRRPVPGSRSSFAAVAAPTAHRPLLPVFQDDDDDDIVLQPVSPLRVPRHRRAAAADDEADDSTWIALLRRMSEDQAGASVDRPGSSNASAARTAAAAGSAVAAPNPSFRRTSDDAIAMMQLEPSMRRRIPPQRNIDAARSNAGAVGSATPAVRLTIGQRPDRESRIVASVVVPSYPSNPSRAATSSTAAATAAAQADRRARRPTHDDYWRSVEEHASSDEEALLEEDWRLRNETRRMRVERDAAEAAAAARDAANPYAAHVPMSNWTNEVFRPVLREGLNGIRSAAAAAAPVAQAGPSSSNARAADESFRANFGLRDGLNRIVAAAAAASVAQAGPSSSSTDAAAQVAAAAAPVAPVEQPTATRRRPVDDVDEVFGAAVAAAAAAIAAKRARREQ